MHFIATVLRTPGKLIINIIPPLSPKSKITFQSKTQATTTANTKTHREKSIIESSELLPNQNSSSPFLQAHSPIRPNRVNALKSKTPSAQYKIIGLKHPHSNSSQALADPSEAPQKEVNIIEHSEPHADKNDPRVNEDEAAKRTGDAGTNERRRAKKCRRTDR